MGAVRKPSPGQKPADPDVPDEIEFSGGIRGRKGPRQVAALLRHERGVGPNAPNGAARSEPDAPNGKAAKPASSSVRTQSGVTDWSVLVGKFFHAFGEDGKISRQGIILADLGGGYYVVGHFEWITGHRSFYGTRVVHISTVASESWALYPDAEAMREAYEYGGAARKG